MTPVTVLMTVYNGEAYLKEAIDSILNQTHTDFKLLIIDNASTDRSRDIVLSYNDSRIHLEPLPQNIGQVAALNKGLDMIETPLAARMDADDISLPQRLERQLAFMEKNRDIGICGTDAVMFRDREEFPKTYPTTPADIKAALFFGCSLAHPSVIMRKSLLDRYKLRYDEQLGHSEDWDLWQRACFLFPLANIPEIHLRYRLHTGSVSHRTEERKKRTAGILYDRFFRLLGLQDSGFRNIHMDIAAGTFDAWKKDIKFILQTLEWLRTIRMANRSTGVFDETALERQLEERLFAVLNANTHLGGFVMGLSRKAKLHRKINLRKILKFYIKALLRRG